jgi:hypothetical protein
VKLFLEYSVYNFKHFLFVLYTQHTSQRRSKKAKNQGKKFPQAVGKIFPFLLICVPTFGPALPGFPPQVGTKTPYALLQNLRVSFL